MNRRSITVPSMPCVEDARWGTRCTLQRVFERRAGRIACGARPSVVIAPEILGDPRSGAVAAGAGAGYNSALSRHRETKGSAARGSEETTQEGRQGRQEGDQARRQEGTGQEGRCKESAGEACCEEAGAEKGSGEEGPGPEGGREEGCRQEGRS